MKKLTKYHKRIRLTFAAAAFICCFILLLIFNSVGSFASQMDYYVVKIGGETVGSCVGRQSAEDALSAARMELSREADSIIYIDSAFSIEKENRLFAKTDSEEELTQSIYEKLKGYTDTNYVQAIMMSADEYMLMVDSADTADAVLQALLNKYDTDNEYDVSLSTQQEGDFVGITYEISNSEEVENRVQELISNEGMTRADAEAAVHKLVSVSFEDGLEIRPVYTDSSAVHEGEDAIRQALDGPETIGVITSVKANYDEEYYAEVVYVEDDTMYEGKNAVERPAVAGTRNVDAIIHYTNGEESSRDIIAQKVLTEPVAQIVRTGTMPPPQFVIPLENCTLSSGFGYRWGALHKGNDYACGYGEPIFASCPGTVEEVVYDSSYGNYVLIRHDEHTQTRYAHMSRHACSVGQKVNRYDVIGYAGSTGNSTGNHCHFEIIIDGVVVNPDNYLN